MLENPYLLGSRKIEESPWNETNASFPVVGGTHLYRDRFYRDRLWRGHAGRRSRGCAPSATVAAARGPVARRDSNWHSNKHSNRRSNKSWPAARPPDWA